jgi:hypothetical protein
MNPHHKVVELAAAVEARLPELIDRTVRQILDEIPVYGSGEFVTHEQLRASTAANLNLVMRALREAGPPDLSEASVTGRARALQGSPLPELLRAFRIGFTEVWNELVERAAQGAPGDLPSLVSATSAIWSLLDDYAESLTSTYRDTTAELMITQQKERSALVEALFAGSAVTQGALWDIARLLDLSLDGTFVVVAAETPGLGQEALPRIENRLRERNHGSAWRLTPDLQVGVVSLRDPHACDVVLDLLREEVHGRVGVSPVYTGLANTARALHLARVALSSLLPGRSGTVQFGESPLAVLVASAPEASAQLAHHVLRPVLDLPADDRDVLLSTLNAWFDCGGSTDSTAARLFCHPNTVRHRLRRVSEALGRSLRDPADIAELGAALRAQQLFSDRVHLPSPSTRRP